MNEESVSTHCVPFEGILAFGSPGPLEDSGLGCPSIVNTGKCPAGFSIPGILSAYVKKLWHRYQG